MHIALFGTSADPPTAGHQTILNWLSYHYDQVRVWASDNPFKTHQTPLEHRATMLKLLIDDIQPSRHNIHCDQRLSSPKALITVEQAEAIWPEARFTLVVGADLTAKIASWYRADNLLSRVSLLVIPRPGYAIVQDDIDYLKTFGGEVAIANMKGLPVSSTAYREARDANSIIPLVQDYIHQKQLYECQETSRNTLPTR